MKRRALHKGRDIVTAHGDNNLFSRQSLGCHLDARFRLNLAIDDIVDLINFLGIKGWECFLDFQNFQSIN